MNQPQACRIIGRLWCDPEMASTEMDAEIADAITRILLFRYNMDPSNIAPDSKQSLVGTYLASLRISNPSTMSTATDDSPNRKDPAP